MPTKPKGTLVPRNPVARSPLLRKGGAHEKSKTSQRRQQRAAIQTQLEDWREDLEFERSLRSDSQSLYQRPSITLPIFRISPI